MLAPQVDESRVVWEQSLRGQVGILDVAVTLQVISEPLGYCHLSDVLPSTHLGTHQFVSNAALASDNCQPVIPVSGSLSLLEGKPLILPVRFPDTLPVLLQQQAAAIAGEQWIFVDADGQEHRQSYAQFLIAAEAILAGLRQTGLQPQDKVILQLGNNQDILTAFWGCVLGGFIPVIMSPPPSYRERNNDLERLLHVYQHLQQPYILSDAARCDSVGAMAQWCEADAQRLLVLEQLRTYAPDTQHHRCQVDDVAFFTLTSGSTGAPKCIPLTHRNLIQRAVGANQANAHQADDVILNWLPFDHIGSISDWHIRCVVLGCTLVYVPKEYVLNTPLNWLGLIDHYRVTHSWAPNFAYSLILNALAEQGGQGDWDLSCVKGLLTAGEAVSPATVAAFLHALAGFGFPPHAICPAFGMAEMGSGVTYFHASASHPLRFHTVSRASLDSTDGVVMVTETAPDAVSFTSLGAPVPGISLRLVDANGELVSMGAVGHLHIKGAAVASGYYQNPQANAQAFLEGGWFDTGDLGFFVDGELVISGRAKEVIIINGANFANAEIEAVVESVSGVAVSFTAACAVRMPGQIAEQLAIFFVPQATARLATLLPAIQESLLKTLGLMPAYLIPLERHAIPKTAIGKIQRQQLATRLESGALDAVLKQVDVLLGNERTVPDWFYQRAWQAQSLAPASVPADIGLHLIVADRLGLAETLKVQLEAQGNTCLCVSPTTSVTQIITQTNLPLVHVWYLTGYTLYTDETEQDLYRLLALVQALAALVNPTAAPLALSVVATHAQAIGQNDAISPAKATVSAFLKSLAAELPWLICRHIDLPIRPLAQNTACLLAEVTTEDTAEEVVWRDGVRYVARLRKTILTPAANTPLVRGGLYLLTGGLGGMGVELATFLLQQYAARLLLVGQTTLPTTGNATDTKTVARLAAWQQLQEIAHHAGGEVQYLAVDVGDTAALAQAVQHSEAHWQTMLSGVFHLAGTSHEKPVLAESHDSIAALLRPKLAGALAIQPLLQQRSQAFVVYSASAAGFFGGANIAAYAAANAYLDALAIHQQQQGLRSYSLAWSMWDDVGMSRGANVQAIFAAKGYCLISPQEAMRSLLVALAQGQPSLLIGLDGGKAHIRQYRADVPADATETVAYCVLADGFSLANLSVPNGCRLEVVDAIPRMTDGTPDFEALQQQTQPDQRNASSRYLAPRTPLEIQLVGIWQTVLKKPKIGVQDNFFALGGASLQAIQCMARINQALGLELLAGALFAHPTIEALAEHIAHHAPSATARGEIPRRAADAPLLASFAQQRLWFLDELEAGDAYNIPVVLRLNGGFDLVAFQQAFDAVVQRHAVLRTHFPVGETRPVVQTASPALIPCVNLSQLAHAARETVVLRHARADAQCPFVLARDVLLRAKLLRLAVDQHVLLLNLHHIAGDGWSISVLARELRDYYAGFSQQQPVALPALPIQYADFAAWQRDMLQGERLQQLLGFWKQQLSGAPALLQLPTDFPRPDIESYQGGQQRVHIPAALATTLKTLGAQAGATLYMTLLAAFNVLLYRYSGQDDLVVGSPVACRNRPELEPLIGFFANTLALRTQVDDAASFQTLLAQVRQTAQAAFDHQDVPFEKLVEELQLPRTLAYNPLVQVLFALQNVSASEFSFAGVSSEPLEVPAERSLFDLELQLWETPNGLEGFFLYKTALFRAETMQRMAGHFLMLLQCIITNPQQPVGTLPLLPSDERQRVLHEWSGVNVPSSAVATVLTAFAQQVECTPHHIAVVDTERGAQSGLTYRELNTRANQVAHYLRGQGIGAEMPVGLSMQRSVDMLVGLLGILKVGGVYLPLDPAYPAERTNFILAQTQASVVLTQQNMAEALRDQPTHNPDVTIHAAHLAYLIYTSGSTGQPKGVMVEHGALASHTLTMQQHYTLTAQDRVLQFASMSFDVALEQILPALISGAQVVIAQADVALDVFSQQMQAQGVSVCDLPPAYLQQVLEYWEAEQWQAVPSSLRLLIVGNDVVPPEIVALWRKLGQAVGRDIRLLNAYGPTEATITATCHELVSDGADAQRIPIGRPVVGKTVYVLDAQLQAVPIGVPAELYIGGNGLARGYWQREDLTAERFIANPFGAGCLYRTGDLARWLPDGILEFIGRVDHQVKIRGFRIELGEIETLLTQHPAIQEAAVIAREDTPGQKRLVAYWVNKPAQALTAAELTTYLQGVLPAYMIPVVCVPLEVMPHTANGKINRKALPAPAITTDSSTDTYVAPTQPLQQQLADIWASVLGRTIVGIHDNFFELGGDSILSLQVVARARQQGLVFQPKQLFQYQTIAKLVNVVEQADASQSQAEQGLVTGAVALSPIQHWFFAQALVDAHHHNLAFRAEVAATIQPELLAEALRQVSLHHDALRSRFTREGESWQQTCDATVASNAVEVIDLTALSAEQQQERWLNERIRLQASLNLETGELQRLALFRFGTEQPAHLCWVIHHLVVDGVSWRVLLEDLQTAYQQLQQGQPVKLPAKTMSFQAWNRWLATAGLQQAHSELPYWQQVCATLTPALMLDFPANHAANTVASQAHVLKQLSVVATRTLLQEAHQAYHTQINDLLLTALLQAFAKQTGQTCLRLDMEGHGREQLDLSRTVGWFTSLYPVVLTLAGNDPATAIKSVKEQLRAIPNRGMGYGVLRYVGKAQGLAGQGADLCFNYLGQFDTADAAQDALLRHAVLDMESNPHSLQQQRPYALEINCLVQDGQLQVDWSYSTALHRSASIETLATAFMAALQALLAHCQDPQAGGYTSSDFAQAKLKQNQLDQLLNRIKVGKRK